MTIINKQKAKMNSLDDKNNSIDIDKSLNTIFLIGNGFDLAHGLKTSYLDFFADVLIKTGDHRNLSQSDKEVIINLVKRKPGYSGLKKGVDKIESPFLKKLYNSYSEYNWMDIECFFYKTMHSILNDFEITIPKFQMNPKTHQLEQQEELDIRSKEQQIDDLNKDFQEITKMLYNYIAEIDKKISSLDANEIIASKISNYSSRGSNYIINFNYTSTIDLYLNDSVFKYNNLPKDLIYINGNVFSGKYKDYRDIIFGYGDEYSEDFKIFKRYSNALSLSKSTKYSTSKEYRKIRHITNMPFNLVILGHSCGSSDRSLLSDIIDNNNLREVYILCKDYEDNSKRLSSLRVASKTTKIINADIDDTLC